LQHRNKTDLGRIHVIFLNKDMSERPVVELLDALEVPALTLEEARCILPTKRHADWHGTQELHHESKMVFITAV
jgi:hypothetical protein